IYFNNSAIVHGNDPAEQQIIQFAPTPSQVVENNYIITPGLAGANPTNYLAISPDDEMTLLINFAGAVIMPNVVVTFRKIGHMVSARFPDIIGNMNTPG